ncbi:MFS transporter [Agromyces luteolus]|uniref:MFS transporter n=1 Tax=Agromyces luteolus TaxID=88373 RepID=A0A7C9HHJ5_9MICO|nr:MFS transporter [Agromyces luteolus]MUN07128.1 MFS transporter [Agromyces luteolus]GLK27288.1 MFS transporter [Agromyces luteolus]
MPITSSSRAGATTMPWRSLVALAAAVFLSITIEMLPTGLLPEMSADLGVGAPLVGLLVSVFAFTVVVTSTPLTALLRRMPRRTLITIVLVVLGLSTAASALVPDYGQLVAVRVVGGVAHGLFWALVGAYPARLVGEQHLGRAVSVVLGGGTLALIAGVPLATALGQAVGWRWAFGVVAALTLAGAVVVRAVLPPDTAAPQSTAPDGPAVATGVPGAEPADRRSMRGVVAVSVVTAVVMIGQYAALTYVAPLLTDVVGASSAAVAPLLFASGLAGAVGLLVAGSPIARDSVRALVGAMLLLAIALLVIAAEPGLWPAIIAYTVWGFAFGAVPPLLQTRLLQAAPADRRDAASALYTTAFNVGIGGGALVGAVLFDAVGVGAVPVAYAVLLVAAMLIVVRSSRAERARARTVEA